MVYPKIIGRMIFMNDIYKEVRFDQYCKKCKHCNKKEDEEPCDECLEACMNEGTNRPRLWEEKK